MQSISSRFISLFILLLIAFAPTAKAHNVYSVSTVPNPKSQGQQFYVSNPDNILSYQAVNTLNAIAQSLENEIDVELCVVVIDEFEETFFGDAHDFCVDLFNHWGIGKHGKNTGVLIFLARESRDIQIITGGGLEGLLPDITCGEIIDNHISLLSNGDYNNGLIAIAQDIKATLNTGAAKAELLLGWTAKKYNPLPCVYFIGAFILLIILSIYGYKQLKGTEGERGKDIERRTQSAQTIIGLASIFFPLPILFFYFLFKRLRSQAKDVPVVCKHCKRDMHLLNDGFRALHLSAVQLAEERVQSKDYDVWQCEQCKRTASIEHNGRMRSRYMTCPSCGGLTYTIADAITLRNATYTHTGEKQESLCCANCGHTDTRLIILPILQRLITASTGGGGHHRGGFGGGSFGGGAGSFGGGMTFGGGAGRKF